jgi:hypothetical protein
MEKPPSQYRRLYVNTFLCPNLKTSAPMALPHMAGSKMGKQS